MRKLFILRGAMGVGKSTFIKEHNLEKYTLSADNLRLMFNSPEMSEGYRECIPQFNNKKVWELLYYLLEERMKKGELTILDAVHAYYDSSLAHYKKLAEKYRYRLYIIDFTGVPVEEVYKRNLDREKYKIVPNSEIDRVYRIFSKEKIPSSFTIIKPNEFEEVVKNIPINYDKYEKVHIIGDIHGCYTALKTYFDKYPINKNDAYIFVGDYFDRGIENTNIFKYLKELMSNDNMYFLLGNHEDKLYKYACDEDFKMDYDIKNTIKEFESNNIKKSEFRGFVKRLSQISYFNFSDKTYLVTHGGIPYIPDKSLDFYSTNSIVYSPIEFTQNIDKLYNDFMVNKKDKIYQIHGHRNLQKIKYNEYEYSYNLEGDIEHGGSLRVLTLNKNSLNDYVEIENKVYNHNLKEETNVYTLIESLRNNKYVFEKELGNNISSFNFTKEAFYNRVWDNMTTQARGLFIDTNKYKVIARSYNKFFNINERKETKIEYLEDKFLFPVNFYLKYNGFLGILSINNNELFFASKSTNTGDYVQYFKNIFYKIFDEKQINKIKEKLINEDLTFVFEVIDYINDPHIIKYDKENIILLDAIDNKTEFSKLNYDELKKFALENNITIKEKSYTAKNVEEFKEIYNLVIEENYKYDNKYIEGFVIEDNKGFMVKLKTSYYSYWKYLRNKLEYAIKNNDYSSSTKDEFEKSFLTYLEKKYKDTYTDISKINIISEREQYYSEK